MSTAAEDQGWKPARLLRPSARWCDICNGWTDHHTDRHTPEDEASPAEVQAALAEARRKIREFNKEHP